MYEFYMLVFMSFLLQVTHKQATLQRYGYWWKVIEEAVMQVAGTHTLMIYVDMLHATVAEWVSNRPIFDVCAREKGYKGGGRLRVLWWRQKTAEDQLRVTVESILAAARV